MPLPLGNLPGPRQEAEYLLETVQDSGTAQQGGGISDTDGLSRNYNRMLVTKNVVLPSNIMNMQKFEFIFRSYPYSFVKSRLKTGWPL